MGSDDITNTIDEQDTQNEDGGFVDSFSLQNEELKVSTINFRWPTAEGRPAATGKGATQGDGTYVLVDGYVNGISPKGVALEEFFPQYFEQTKNAFARSYGSNYTDAAFTSTMDGVSTINGYKVCKYTGQHTFKFKGVDYSYQFVSYVTTLKGNGAYVYWLVQDETADQSAGKQMEENALKIIQSVRED